MRPMVGREGMSEDERERRVPTGMRLLALLLVLDAVLWRVGRRVWRRS